MGQRIGERTLSSAVQQDSETLQSHLVQPRGDRRAVKSSAELTLERKETHGLPTQSYLSGSELRSRLFRDRSAS